MDNNDDNIVDEIVSVFLQARQLAGARRPNGRGVSLEMEANDLLMDYALLLGPTGLAEVMLILEEEQNETPLTVAETASAVEFVLKGISDQAPRSS
jgi:hypothetical protein